MNATSHVRSQSNIRNLSNAGSQIEAWSLIDAGYRLVNPAKTRNVAHDSREWRAFAATWHQLPSDRYDDAATTRRSRRLTRFRLTSKDLAIKELPNAPFVQSGSINAVHGGIQRIFEPLNHLERFLSPIRDLILFDYTNAAAIFAPEVMA